ncbi:hypothetical protein D3C81_1388230 [compost metagenome]
MRACACSSRYATSANCSVARIRPTVLPCVLPPLPPITRHWTHAWRRSSSMACRTISAVSVLAMLAVMFTTRSTGPPARPCLNSATCARACSRQGAATCSTRFSPHELLTAAGRVPRWEICWHSPIAVVSFPLPSRNVPIRGWPFSTCTPPVRYGARGKPLLPVPLANWKRQSAHGSQHFAIGWPRRAWITNGAFCGSLLAA